MMKATQILMEEHRVIERVIASMEEATRRLETGAPIDPGFFIDAAQFIQGFADGCHHKKEEGVLFKAMVASGLPSDDGPVAMMLAEHEQGRVYTRAMRAAAEKLQAGDQSARAAVIFNARGYATLLKNHIAKEDGVLFPMANQVIAPAEQEQVAEGFKNVEHEETGEGVHEKYLALANHLAAEARGERAEARG